MKTINHLLLLLFLGLCLDASAVPTKTDFQKQYQQLDKKEIKAKIKEAKKALKSEKKKRSSENKYDKTSKITFYIAIGLFALLLTGFATAIIVFAIPIMLLISAYCGYMGADKIEDKRKRINAKIRTVFSLVFSIIWTIALIILIKWFSGW